MIFIVPLVVILMAVIWYLADSNFRLREQITKVQAELVEAEQVAFERASKAYEKQVKAARKDAINRSQAVILGKVAEHLAPLMGSFEYNPKDCRFLGSPVDFIVFDGLSEGDLREIVFVEVKTGSSRLSRRERSVRDCVESREVLHEEYRI